MIKTFRMLSILTWSFSHRDSLNSLEEPRISLKYIHLYTIWWVRIISKIETTKSNSFAAYVMVSQVFQVTTMNSSWFQFWVSSSKDWSPTKKILSKPQIKLFFSLRKQKSTMTVLSNNWKNGKTSCLMLKFQNWCWASSTSIMTHISVTKL